MIYVRIGGKDPFKSSSTKWLIQSLIEDFQRDTGVNIKVTITPKPQRLAASGSLSGKQR